jgi:hypothetical protein
LRIFNANNGDAAVPARIADQSLPSAAIDTAEREVRRIRRKGLIAIEPDPTGRRAFQGSQRPLIAADLNFGDTVNHNFEGTLAIAAATPYIGANRRFRLRINNRGHEQS